MRFTTIFAISLSLAAAASLVSGSAVIPAASTRRADAMCGDWDKVEAASYTIQNNLWNKGKATSGKQCIMLEGSGGSGIQWSSTWSWAGGQDIPKSYPNALVNVQQVQLSKIASIKSSWAWTYTGTKLRADVSYDIFTSDSPGGAKKYEMMIWLAQYDVNPIAASYGPGGKATAEKSDIQIQGHTWSLYKGSFLGAAVLSFLPTDGKPINSFSADINDFFKYLVTNKYVPADQYLLSFGAGTEPFEGQDAKFTTSNYATTLSYH